jgi:hypothetical protein
MALKRVMHHGARERDQMDDAARKAKQDKYAAEVHALQELSTKNMEKANKVVSSFPLFRPYYPPLLYRSLQDSKP